MRDTDRHVKVVEWSEDDQCYVGTAPGFFHGGCHGTDERAVFAELCVIVDETVATIRADGAPLPDPTIGKIHLTEAAK